MSSVELEERRRKAAEVRNAFKEIWAIKQWHLIDAFYANLLELLLSGQRLT